MKNTRNLLFITWDGASSNYLETLFFPILKGLQQYGFQTSVFQFSWAPEVEVDRIRELAKNYSINYFHQKIYLFPPRSISAWWSLMLSKKKLLELIDQQQIDILMPRSTMPAWIVKMLYGDLTKRSIKIVFDADGLPILERVDFAGLRKGSWKYQSLFTIESFLIQHAYRILCRSNSSIAYHLKNHGQLSKSKFVKVVNGRDSDFFIHNTVRREEIRKKLGIQNQEMLWVHSGSIGKAYDLDTVFGLMRKRTAVKLLILTRQINEALGQVPADLKERVMVESAAFFEIPSYLSAADLGIALRTPAPSLKGLAPIKLGEYLLCGLPVLANPEIGDLEEEMSAVQFCFLFQKGLESAFFKWLDELEKLNSSEIRAFGVSHYSLEESLKSYLKALEI